MNHWSSKLPKNAADAYANANALANDDAGWKGGQRIREKIEPLQRLGEPDLEVVSPQDE